MPTNSKKLGNGNTEDQETDEWDQLLLRNTYWRVLPITAGVLRFKINSLARSRKRKKVSSPLGNEERTEAKQHWVRKAQRGIYDDMERPGWNVVRDKERNLLKYTGRI